MGVAGAPAGEEDLADVRLVVAIGILEEQGYRAALVDDEASVGEDHAGGNGELVREDDALLAFPSPSVSSQILIWS